MKINKHGKTYNKEEASTKEKFTCENCECEFTVKDDEYYVDLAGADSNGWTSSISVSTYTISTTTRDYLVCSCPECHKICKKIRERKNQNYYASPTITTVNLDTSSGSGSVNVSEAVADSWEYALNESLTMK